ncbi:MAG: T9SS type A sorting domain-containing protein [Cryomorphaceae bacterium]|nr:T9SS type A sorting domain-containing protein [Cryomorphaceae bacterium]
MKKTLHLFRSSVGFWFVLLVVFVNANIYAQPIVIHNNPVPGNIFDILETGNQLWLAEERGVTITTNHGMNDSIILQGFLPAKFCKNDNDIWVGGKDSVGVFDGQNWQFFKASDGLPSSFSTKQLQVDGRGILWLLLDNAVYSYDGNGFTNMQKTALQLAVGDSLIFILNPQNQILGSYYDGNTWNAMPAFPNDPAYQMNFGFSNTIFKADKNDDLFVGRSSIPRLIKLSGGVWSYDQLNFRHTFTVDNGVVYFLDGKLLNKFFNGQLDTLALLDGSPPSGIQVAFHSDIRNGKFFYAENHSIYKILPTVAERNTQHSTLSSGNVETGLTSYGVIGAGALKQYYFKSNYKSEPRFFTQNFWLSVERNSENGTAADEFRQRGICFFSGPIGQTMDSAYVTKYDRVWKLTKDEIDQHIRRSGNPFYRVPESISSWPGNGDVQNGEPHQLAPFVDVNGNGIYEPHLGDYPEIRGDVMLYAIFNDQRIAFRRNLSVSVGVDVHCMIYAFDDPNVPETKDAIFYHYKVVNRSDEDWRDVRVAQFTDLEIGDYPAGLGDMFGSDSTKNMVFAYTQNEMDSTTGTYPNPPAVVGGPLHNQLEGVLYYLNTSWPINNAPLNQLDLYNYMRFQNGNNTPNLRLENPSGPGDTNNGMGIRNNPLNPPTQWAFNRAANWYFPPNNVVDVRIVPTIKTGDIAPGESRCVDFYYVFGENENDQTGNILASLVTTEAKVPIIKSYFYDKNFGCFGGKLDVEAFEAIPKHFRIYPNPLTSDNKIMVEHDGNGFQRVAMYSMAGTTVKVTQVQRGNLTEIEVPKGLSNGMYILQLMDENGKISSHKILVGE